MRQKVCLFMLLSLHMIKTSFTVPYVLLTEQTKILKYKTLLDANNSMTMTCLNIMHASLIRRGGSNEF